MTRTAGIGISGSAGTGKSTLGTRLASRLEVPYLPEGMRERLEGGLDLHRLAHLELRALLLCDREDPRWPDRLAALTAAFRHGHERAEVLEAPPPQSLRATACG